MIRDHRVKVVKQRRSPTPADYTSGHLIPTSVYTITKLGIKIMFISISAGVGDLPCFPTF